MSAAQAGQVLQKRWDLVDDMCTTEAELAAFYKSDAWLEYLTYRKSHDQKSELQ